MEGGGGPTFRSGPSFARVQYIYCISMLTVSHNFKIPSISSCFIRCFTSLLLNSFNSCHKFSVGLRSGDYAGVFHQSILLSTMKSFSLLDICFGSLCSVNWETCLTNGLRVLSRISVKRNLSIIASKMQTSILRFLEIPAQTCTFAGCFGLRGNEQNGDPTNTPVY